MSGSGSPLLTEGNHSQKRAALVSQANIDARHEHADKYSGVLEDLSLIAHAGDHKYGDEPLKALQRVKAMDLDFDTDISAELNDIALRVAEAGGPTITLNLPSEPVPGVPQDTRLHHIDSTIKNLGHNAVNVQLDAVLSARQRKRRQDHPGEVVTQPRTTYNVHGMASPRPIRRMDATSQLEGLFSKAKHEDAAKPGFLLPQGTNRKEQVKLKAMDQQKKMMARPGAAAAAAAKKRSPSPRPKPRTKTAQGAAASSRFLDAHKPPETRSVVFQKPKGEEANIIFDPETLCLIDARMRKGGGTAQASAAELAACRGMKIMSVGPGSGEAAGEPLHSAAALRRALAAARAWDGVVVKLEPWSRKKQVTKRQTELRQKFVSGKEPKAGSSR